jgi:hypothetical protein
VILSSPIIVMINSEALTALIVSQSFLASQASLVVQPPIAHQTRANDFKWSAMAESFEGSDTEQQLPHAV